MDIVVKTKMFVVFRSRLAEYLGFHGVKPNSIQVDKFDPTRTVWVYKVNQNLIDALNGYEIMRNHDRRYKLAD